MIKLVQFFPAWNLPNASPFCMKLETYLKMAELPYENKYTANPNASPTGKFPVIEDQGKVIADSGLIIEYLKNTYGDKLDTHLTTEEKATVVSLHRLIEEHLYWSMIYSRWLDKNGWAITKPTYFGRLPLLLKSWLPSVLQKKVKRQLEGHGMGLHDEETIYHFGKENIKALSDFLGNKDFFFGDKPTSLDACAYSFLSNIINTPIESPLKQYALTFSNLKNYCDRMQKKYFP